MAAKRDDQFVYILSSDGCKDIYPENSAGDFKIMLTDPIVFPDEEKWEVGLVDIHYPCSWVNVGPKVGMEMHYVDHEGRIQAIVFPNWHCETLKELAKYIQSQMPDDYVVELDSLGRFVIKSKGLACPISMSAALRGTLGLENSENLGGKIDLMRRMYITEQISKYWKNNPLDADHALLNKVLNAREKYVELATLLKTYLNLDAFINTERVSDAYLETSYGAEILKHIGDIAVALGVGLGTTQLAHNFAVFYKNLYRLYEMPLFPKEFVAQSGGDLHKMERLFLHTNIIEPMDMNETTSNILKVFKIKGQRYKVTQEIFQRPTYQALKKGKISMIRMYIADQSGKVVPFESGTVLVTLHFRKQKRGRVLSYYGGY